MFVFLTYNLCKGLLTFSWKGKSNRCLDAEIVPGNLAICTLMDVVEPLS